MRFRVFIVGMAHRNLPTETIRRVPHARKNLPEFAKKMAEQSSILQLCAIKKGMEILDTIEARSLEPRRFNPLNDFLFYKVMGEKGDEPQLIGFLNAVLGPSGRKPIESVEIIEKKSIMKDMLRGKSCKLDVMAFLSDGTKVNIEVQIQDHHNMDRRTLFYCSKLYTENLREGQDYSELANVVAINIVSFDFPPSELVHTRFRLREDSDPTLVLTDALEIHFVNMVRWRELGAKNVAGNPLHRWLAWLDPQSPPELVKEVKDMDGAIMVAEQKQDYVMQDKEARELYEMRQKAERDRISELNTAEQKGMERGLQEGEQIGLQKGKQIGLQKGEQIGLQKGRQEGLQESRQELSLELLALLNKKHTPEDLKELASRWVQ